MGSIISGYDKWLCPYCGEVAILETEQCVLCDSRTCSCGAIALAAPIVDTDEIIDDALGLFAVQIHEESKGYDQLMLNDLHRAGVDIRQGEPSRVHERFLGNYTSLWFRRVTATVSTDQ